MSHDDQMMICSAFGKYYNLIPKCLKSLDTKPHNDKEKVTFEILAISF